jgi:hypothetical protein
VAKLSGRGLGVSGGTIDKLESIPGFSCNLSKEQFRNQVEEIGLAIIEAGDLAPADREIYALRDTTGTVDSLPLIGSSIVSKKVATGAGHLLYDVKRGSGAFMKTTEEARELARLLVRLSEDSGIRASALITDMDNPLGSAVGNALEVRESVRFLMGDEVPEDLRGLDRYEARRRVLGRLRDLGLVVREERPYPRAVGHCYRCHSEIEPWLSGKQWFVAVDRLKGPARKAAEDGRIRFWPDRWTKVYVEWLDNLRDWNISRQLWWGHRIPVWYCPEGHEFASVEDPAACPRCGAGEIEQDPDVLDTWFSSQLWPFSTLGWPEETEDLAFFYPTAVLFTCY